MEPIPEFVHLHLSEQPKELRKKRDEVIVKLHTEGMALTDIGAAVSLSREQVRRILKNRTQQ